MSDSKSVVQTALVSVIALGAFAIAGQAIAAKKPEMEKCAGVIKGGQNDCATSMNACHGHVSTDANPEAWIYLPKGTCQKIVGARLTFVKAPDEK